jgi:D-alanyl-D-alanine dipeptidase
MWKNRFEPQYVADPAKGSIHNRGGAVDITLVDANYNELDMGTPFDFRQRGQPWLC